MNLLVRRDDFLAVSGFHEEFQTAEDVDLCDRPGQRGPLLCNPALAAVPWGEARDLQIFWRKAVGRGLGNLGGVRSHGLRWDELPSLAYPRYIADLLMLLIVGGVLDACYRQLLFAPIRALLLSLPPLLLALNTARLARPPTALFRLFLLYLVLRVGACVCGGQSVSVQRTEDR